MSTNARRFGEIVLARRLELDMNQLDVYADGGPSNSTLTNIENGRLEDLSRSTARKLDKGLHWEPGSARSVWDGGYPIPLGKGQRPHEEDVLAELRSYIGAAEVDDALRRRLLEVIEDERGAAG